MDNVRPAAEQAKIDAHYLRGTLAAELETSDPQFSKPATSVLKFHGIYQQDDREARKVGPKQYSAMIRVGVAGGRLTPEQYLALDRIADIGDGSLRITTRQDIQYHYVPKARLRELIGQLHANYLSTLAACGDVVRNVVSCPAPFQNEQRSELWPFVEHLSRNLKPKTSAYYDIWIGGELAASGEATDVEPLYGATYLPRKFKINFTFPGDNTTDVYANDIGIVPCYEQGVLTGFTILAGGGMGQSAGVKTSHPRLSDPICFVGPTREELLEVATAIVTIHRDFGNRTNRKLARLKYVMDAWGPAKFKLELEQRVGRELAPPKQLEWSRADDYLGWRRQGEGTWFVGVRVVSGRIRDFDAQRRVRTGLRTIVEKFRLEVRLTPQQNLYLAGIRDKDKPEIAGMLHSHGIAEPEALPPVLRYAIACPALPTCGQALTESERIMPEVVAEIQAELDAVGLPQETVHLRTSGCPNGCSRPYTAEIGIVGTSVNMYTVYLGASPLGTRLGEVFAERVKRQEVAGLLRPVLERFKDSRREEEAFGDFCDRVGIAALREASACVA
ncbi:MAG TPA: NADPH-dependent assimilatory sulfite reductase hemoprotein subunit [Bryobacteraceae bacterium]|nr:NADPH-dependent assimilatory sulfite reductase hemoprotein subunit [Bryobacteraceae bacterium]